MLRRWGASAIGFVLLAAAATSPALAETAADPATRLNPTSRTLSLIVDLREANRRLGEVAIRIAPDDTISVQKSQLERASTALLRPDAAERLRALAAPGGFVTLVALNEAGFRYKFDHATMQLFFNPSIEQRPRGEVSLRPGPADAPPTAMPASLSGYLNIRTAADHIESSFTNRTGLTAPRADFEGVLRWQDVVLEAEATYDGARAAWFAGGTDDHRPSRAFARRSTRLVYDLPDDALRIQAGDINPPVTSLQRGSDLLGVSVERSPRKLRPGENIRPTGKRSFRIARPSSVKIELNGAVVRQLRLAPGEYDLDDLPLRGGANRIRLIITDDVGEQRTLDFTSYFSGTLLAEGISEWGLGAGVLSRFDGDGVSYDFERPIASGFYRLGLSPELTGEAHLQAGRDAALLGASLHSASALGFFAVEAGASYLRSHGPGAALEIDWDVLQSATDGASLRMSAALRSPHFAPPGAEGHHQTYWLDLQASYSRPLPFDVHASLTGRYAFASEQEHDSPAREDVYGVALGLSKTLSPTLGMSLSMSYSSDSLSTFTALEPDADDEGELRAALQLTWRPDAHSRVAASFEAGEPAAAVAASRSWRSGVDTWHTSIETLYDDGAGDLAIDGNLHHAGNRLTASLTHTASLDARAFGRRAEPLTDQRTTLQLGTTIAFAEGHAAIGPPITGPGGFAIVVPHDSLGDNRIVLGSSDRPRAQTDAFGPAIVGALPSYRTSRLTYDVDGLPLGYDLGSRDFHLKAPYRGGYALTVGSAHSVSAFGTLLGTDGAPVALVTGTAQPEGEDAEPVVVFTNGAGRFGAQGLAPGRWRIEMATEPPQHFILEIPPDTSSLFRAGTLHALEP